MLEPTQTAPPLFAHPCQPSILPPSVYPLLPPLPFSPSWPSLPLTSHSALPSLASLLPLVPLPPPPLCFPQAFLPTRWGWARPSRPSPCWPTWPVRRAAGGRTSSWCPQGERGEGGLGRRVVLCKGPLGGFGRKRADALGATPHHGAHKVSRRSVVWEGAGQGGGGLSSGAGRGPVRGGVMGYERVEGGVRQRGWWCRG